MADTPEIRKQRDHCFAEESIDEDDHITMWALGGFVPYDSEDLAAYLAKNRLLKPKLSSARPGRDVAEEENIYRLALVDRMNRFLDALNANGCNIRRACKMAGLNRTAAFDLKVTNPSFSKLWDEVVEGTTDDLEQAGLRRAIDGVEEDIYYRGVKVGTKRVYSDAILTQMLAGRRSTTYKQKVISEVSGPGGGPVQHANLAADEFKQIAKDLLQNI